MEKGGTLVTLQFSSLCPQSSLNPEIWCSSCKQPQALWPRACFTILLLYYMYFNELNLNVETLISLVMLLRQFTVHRPPHSILLPCTLNAELAVSMENTRVLIWQPLVMFHWRIYHPQPTQIPPPTATKNSLGEKCYYEEWLLCDSQCFIKKIFFFQTDFQ